MFLKDGKVVYKDYEKSHEGLVQSYVERFDDAFLKDVYDEWDKYAAEFRYPM